MIFYSKGAPLRGKTVFQDQIPSELRLKTPAVHRVISHALEAGLIPKGEREKYSACVDEALANAIVHANMEDSDLKVYVRVFCHRNVWGIQVEDEGIGFSKVHLPDYTSSGYPWLDHGRGVVLMEEVMDRVEYFGVGKTLVLSKKLIGSHSKSLHEPVKECCLSINVPATGQGTVAQLAIQSATDEEVSQVFESLREYATSCPDAFLVLDFSGVAYLNSLAIACLVRLVQRCIQNAVTLRLAGLNGNIFALFQTVRLTEVFSIFDDVEEAIRSEVVRS